MAIAQQLSIDTTNTALDLANEMFGSGIQVLSATFNGSADATSIQAGIYSGALTTIPGLSPTDTGVILSTGNVQNFAPYTDGTTDTNRGPGTTTDTAGIDGDSQLNVLAGANTFDAAIFQADFIPDANFITLQFVFSSEEYLEYVSGGFNDAFGVWVNGVFAPVTPLAGGTAAIDTINLTQNPNLFLNNPANTDPYNSEMDGLTRVLTVKAPVNAGQTNTIKIAIADAGDAAYDSNVLIMANSIQTMAIAVQDNVNMLASSTRTIDVLSNDTDTTNGGLTVTHINGTAVSPGGNVTLPSGEVVTLNTDGTLTIQTNTGTGASVFTYSVLDSAGNTDVGFVNLTVVSTLAPDGIVHGTTGGDLIQTGYLGDPDGDRVDNNDALGVGGTTGDGDYILAMGGNDTVLSGAGNDIIYAGTGNDSVVAGAGNDYVSLGEGDDTFGSWSSDNGGNDTIDGDEGNDQIIGGAGDDIVYGGIGNDTLSGQHGSDTLFGGDGADEFWITDDHEGDTIFGGDGVDQIAFGNFLTAAGITVTATGNDSGTYAFNATPGGFTQAQGSYDSVEALGLTSYADTYNGAAATGDTTVEGGTGNDTLIGGASNDALYGGGDNDILTSGGGADTLSGGGGADRLVYNSAFADGTAIGGADYDILDLSTYPNAVSVLFTGAGQGTVTDLVTGAVVTFSEIEEMILTPQSDVVDATADNGFTYIQTRDGNDLITGSDGDDIYDDEIGAPNGQGNDTFYGAGGNDVLWMGNDDDLAYGGTGNDFLGGEAGNDTLHGDDGNDTVAGFSGNDFLFGGAGNDSVTGDEDDDSLSGQAGFDSLYGGDGQDTLDGGADADNLFGGDGNDAMYGGDGLDYLEGGVGNDTLFGGTDGAADQFYAGSGNDLIYAGAGDNTLVYGGDGDDTIHGDGGNDILQGEAGNDALYGGTGNDSAAGGDGSDLLDGGDGADLMGGEAGNDTLIGGLGADSLYGGDDADVIYGGAGDVVVGGEGGTDNDTLVLNWADVESITYGGGNNEAGTVTFTAASGGGTLTFSEIEAIRYTGPVDGTSGNDVMNIGFVDAQGDIIDGADGDIDTIFGYEGNDSINAGADTDLVYGGTGNDTVLGGGGNDTVFGEDGDDSLFGEDGNDTITGGDGADYVDGDAGSDSLSGDAGNDTLVGDDGNDTLSGGTGDDQIYASGGDNLASGDAGADQIYLGTGADTLYGGAGNDTMDGGAGSDLAYGDRITFIPGEHASATGGAAISFTLQNNSIQTITLYWIDTSGALISYGDVAPGTSALQGTFAGHNWVIYDTATGTPLQYLGQPADGAVIIHVDGNDYLSGGTGLDTLYGEAGVDTIYGGDDADRLFGGAGNDVLYGDAGDDSLEGGDGDDSLTGGDGADTLLGGAGNDTLDGGEGDDQIFAGDGDDLIDAGAGNDYVLGEGGADTIYGADGNDTLLSRAGDDLVYGGDGDDSILGLTGNDTFFGGTGADTMFGGAYDDLLAGDEGNDSLFGDDGNDLLQGGAGVDSLSGGEGNDTLDGGDEADELFGDAGADSLVGGLGADTAYGGSGMDTVAGGAGNDLLFGGADADLVQGDDGDDVLWGDQGADTLEGGDGNDTLIGGDFAGLDSSADQIYGGAGNDVVEAGAGDDTVDGGDGNDTIRGEAGNDLLSGGGDRDLFVMAPGGGTDTIAGGEDGDDFDTIDTTGILAGVVVRFTGDEAGEFGDIGSTVGATFSEIEALQLGAGNDTVDASVTTSGIVIDAGAGDDLIIGGSGDDTLTGGLGGDTITGGAGNDAIDLGAGDGAEDLLVLTDGTGSDSVTGFAAPADNGDGTFTGLDQLDVSGLTDANGAPVNTDDVTVTDDGNGNAVLTFPNGESITLVGVPVSAVSSPAQLAAMGIPLPDYVVEGTTGNDTIDGSYLGDPEGDMVDAGDNATGTDADVIDAGAGDDSVLAGAGNDTVFGGDGADTLDGGIGNDSLEGGAGADSILGGDGNDTVRAGNGDDTVFGGAGDDSLFGFTGNDVVDGGDGNDLINTRAETGVGVPDRGYPGLFTGDTDAFNDQDTVYGGAGNDTILAGDDNDYVLGGVGDDSIDGGFDDDTLQGQAGNDTILGGEGRDFIEGGAGSDLIYGGLTLGEADALSLTDDVDLVSDNNMDTIFGGDGSDTIYGMDDADEIYGGSGNDLLDGGIDNDLLLGEGGVDTLIGGHGDDVLDGGSGDDSLSGGDGNDTLYGGDPADVPPALPPEYSALSGTSGNLTGTNGNTAFTQTTTSSTGNVFENTMTVALPGGGSETLSGYQVGNGIPSEETHVHSFSQQVAGAQLRFAGINQAESVAIWLDGGRLDLNQAIADGIVSFDPGTGTPWQINEAGEISAAYDEFGVVQPAVLIINVPFQTLEVQNISPSGFGNGSLYELGVNTNPALVTEAGGNDTLDAGAGDDLVDGGDGNDSLLGGDGDDTVSGGIGNDTIGGGAGQDIILVSDDGGTDSVVGGEGGPVDYDTLDLSGVTTATTVTYSGAEAGSLTYDSGDASFAEIERLQLGSGDDTVTAATNAGPVSVGGGAGVDTLVLNGQAINVADIAFDDSVSGTFTPANGGAAIAFGPAEAQLLSEVLATYKNGTLSVQGADLSGTLGDVSFDSFEAAQFNVICFVRGTRIKTAMGEVAIEQLAKGDRVLTLDNGYQPIRWIGATRRPAVGALAPIRIAAGVLGNDRDLLVSPQHRMLLRGWQANLMFGEAEVLVAAKALVNDSTIRVQEGGEVEYFHMLFDRHEIVFAEGALAESFHPGQQGWKALDAATRVEILDLFPELDHGGLDSYGPAARLSLKDYEGRILADTLLSRG